MNDVTTTPVVNALVESKLYVMNQESDLLGFLKPELNLQMIVETEFDADYPRTEEDGDDTRIFVSYTTLKGTTGVYKITDNERLARRWDIDGFMTGFFANVNEGAPGDYILEVLPATLTSALNSALIDTLELSDERVPAKVKAVSTIILQSIVSTILNDPLDAIIIVKEKELVEGAAETDSPIIGLWTIKSRD